MSQYSFFLVMFSSLLLWSCHEYTADIDPKLIPNEWFFAQRAFPYGEIDYKAYQNAVAKKLQKSELRNSIEGYNDPWEQKGPYNINGRITDIEMHEDDTNTIYAGSASGGIFKSIDQGHTWTSIFDETMSPSIGDMAIAPSNQNIIYVGTGEANAGGGSLAYDGLGVFKSEDKGQNWKHIGLSDVGSIGKVVIHPKDEQILYVAAMGRLFGDNLERGVYKSVDGGESWDQALFITEKTGAIDLAIHPNNPDTLYAAMWERVRRPNDRLYGGATSGIYRSYDGGENWVELSGGLPSDAEEKGRIGIAIAPSNPSTLYAYYAKQNGSLEGIFRTDDGGEKWSRLDDRAISDVPFMWWFGKAFVHPTDEDVAFVTSLDMFRTDDGGQRWYPIFEGAHVDHHALFVHPQNPDLIINGNDGGVHVSANGGRTWRLADNMANIQFYTVEIDETFPERLYGGTQDNGTLRTMGPTDTWEMIWGGDGFRVRTDPNDPNVIYAESQRGNLSRSLNGGQSFRPARTGIEGLNNWNAPFVLDPNNSNTLYFGSDRVHKSTNQASNWSPISPIIPATRNNQGVLAYGTITTLAVSTIESEIIIAGTDDGVVSITQNGGGNWTNISNDLPLRWVTSVATDPFDRETIYVTLSGYRYDLAGAHVYKSEDLGVTWEDISSTLPDIPVNQIIVDPENQGAYYVATDIGVYYSLDDGLTWSPLGVDMPIVPVTDLDLHTATRMLAAATYGRSMFTYMLPLNTPTNEVSNNILKVFPNPSFDKVYFEGNRNGGLVQVFSLDGQLLIQHLNYQESYLDISHLTSGIYILKVSDIATKISVLK